MAYQTADELANLIDDIVPRILNTDSDWCKQIRKSTAKVPAQIAEGFARFLPKESAYYYRVARASLVETQSHLRRGLRRNHLSQEEFEKGWKLSEVALKTTTGLLTAKLAQIRSDESNRGTSRRRPRDNQR